MLKLIVQNWKDILSIFIAALSLGVAFYANYRVNAIRRQDMQEEVYKDMQKLLNYKCDYYSATKRLLENYTAVPALSQSEISSITRQIHRYFGRKVYRQFCNLMELCDKAKRIDFDINILFDLIKDGEPEIYHELKEVVENQEYNLYEKNDEYIQTFLGTVSIPMYRFSEEEPAKAYDYLELNEKLDILNRQIINDKSKLEKSLEKEFMKK